MARRRIVPLLLLAGLLAGCGATPDPPPQPAPGRAVAAAEAERLRLLRLAIRRAHRSRKVAGALRYARLTKRIPRATYARHRRTYAAARAAVGRLDGTRAAELATVLGTVDALAAQRLLRPSRLRPVFLVLNRNTEFW